MNPTSGEIINAMYGDGNGGTDISYYTKKRVSNACDINNINIITLSPGNSTIPSTLVQNTIYVLNS